MSSEAEDRGIDPMRPSGGAMSATVPGGLARRTLLGAALIGALPGLWESLRVVGTVILEALPAIETELAPRAR